MIKFRKSSASGSTSGNFLKDYSTLRNGHFFTIWLISLDLRENFIRDVYFYKEVPIKFWKLSKSIVQIRTPDPVRIHLGRGHALRVLWL